MRRIACTAALLAAIGGTAATAATVTITFQPQGGGGVPPYTTSNPGDEGIDTWFGTTFSTTSQAACAGTEEPINCQHLKVGGWVDRYYSFIRFRLNCLPRIATSAVISLYSFPHPGGFTPTPMSIEAIASSWEEATISTLPSFQPYGFDVAAPTPGAWFDIPITEIYNSWQRGDYPNYGLVMIPVFNNRNSNLFRSSDYPDKAYRPKLKVTYDTTQQGSASSFSLCFPMRHDVANDPYTADISSIFDHRMSTPYATPNGVTAMTGDTGSISHPSDITCKKDNVGTEYLRRNVNGKSLNYQGASECGDKAYLSYDNHPGIDYSVPYGTPVYSAIDGRVSHLECIGSSLCTIGTTNFGRVCIRHVATGQVVGYLHLSRQSGNLVVGSTVRRGQLVGYVGGTGPNSYDDYAPHLHVEVRKNRDCVAKSGNPPGVPVDPYGWWGDGPDPYTKATNTFLWR